MEEESLKSLVVWKEEKATLNQGLREMKGNQNRVTIKQNSRKLSRIKNRTYILKLEKYHTQGKTDIEAMLPRFISVKHLDFKIK